MASSEERLLQVYVHFLSMVASCRRLLKPELKMERSYGAGGPHFGPETLMQAQLQLRFPLIAVCVLHPFFV
ncbi:GD14417 [Drosophila simulans]|uniref:GD14417 n=1 Tax=Drosophila simulans TaxID=7240 RepID=B4QRU3_DROSI|nr:GD14417 [Drosophila simulans]